MKDYILVGVVYTVFIACVVVAVYVTGSAWCLWALAFAPSFTGIEGTCDDDVDLERAMKDAYEEIV